VSAEGDWPLRRAAAADADEVARLLHDFNVEFDTPTPGVDVLAARLIELLVNEAHERSVSLVEIDVDEGDVDARRFYERHGFAATEPGSTERALYYFRELTS
jgi:hypothetical protein